MFTGYEQIEFCIFIFLFLQTQFGRNYEVFKINLNLLRYHSKILWAFWTLIFAMRSEKKSHVLPSSFQNCYLIFFIIFFYNQISNDGFWRQRKWVSNISLLWPEIRGFSQRCLASSMVMGPLTPLIVSPTTRQNMKRQILRNWSGKLLKIYFVHYFMSLSV